MLIAEGSDWNWWYGPEHHSANDRDFVYGRLDFIGEVPEGSLELVVNFERPPRAAKQKGRELRLDVTIANRAITTSKLTSGEQGAALTDLAQVRLLKVFEFKLPLYALEAVQGDRVRLRFSLWRDRLPIDALPVEGWIELQLLPDEELRAAAY